MKHDDLTYTIIGFAYKVHNVLGFGFLESVYENAHRIEKEARRIPQELVDAAERQLDYLADLLAGMGVVVRRPDPIDHGIRVNTPDWQVVGGHASACPRDILLVIGNEIIEAPMSQRARYFEFRAYRSLLKEYFHR